ncbi:pentapeptide repeat-containing protein [Streptomyces sp. NBC_00620]|uniref:pentapeptide repeat-containing protein n=1 Tax=Streptomyces sp. NBC_00620 TaxID=2903666 RepID=UPI002251BE57|nr:pentapeptide repeat-containing protein [Streptomyces sp. NBC_00620]MCX4976474.1 pentapeptide repeat-containing protein [Streptomyces sp. NBC_00620]
MPQPSRNRAPSPSWQRCGHGADPNSDPDGCPGIHVSGHTACLAHLATADRDAYLAGLTPGANVDHRGTPFTQRVLADFLYALHDPATGGTHLGVADFGWATFEGIALFHSATFEDDANFASATFKGDASFGLATFKGGAGFESARFEGDALFVTATFEGNAGFGSANFKGIAGFLMACFKGTARFELAHFEGDPIFGLASFEGTARFESATFESGVDFHATTFKGDAWFVSASFNDTADIRSANFEGTAGFMSATFESPVDFQATIFKGIAGFGSATFKSGVDFGLATFKGDVEFRSAAFERASILGPMVCAGQVTLSGATFGGPVTLSFATRRLECWRTRWSSTAEIRLRYATVDFAHAVFEYPLTIAAEPDPFVLADGRQLAEGPFASAPTPGVRLASLRGVDAAHLVLADVDLARCLFAGTVHLDQLRLEGACTFDTVPPAVHWRRWPPVRFTERRALAEEHHWRASQPGAVRGWNVAALGAGQAGPLQLAPVYRALRKAFEDGKHEPGAADFYYGEMEMRRHASDIPRSERGLLTAYWALCGYGLRASRALAWLGAAMLLTIVLLMAVGLPSDTPKQTATGTVPVGGGKVTFEIDNDDPENPTGNRFTGERFEKALNVTLNSVVFRSADQDLTTAGTYTEMASRLTEPVLLALAILAVRNRVKR